jgi:hypothetical protein
MAGIKMGTARTYLEMAVCRIAVLAATIDLPTTYPSESFMSIPVSSSFFLMKNAFRHPAVEQAIKLLNEFAMRSFGPLRPLVYPERAFLIYSATPIDEVTAIA